MLCRKACSALVLASILSVPSLSAAAAPATILNPATDLSGYAIQWWDEFAANAPLKTEWSIRKPGERHNGYNSMDQVSLTNTVTSALNPTVNLLGASLNAGALQIQTKKPGTGASPSIPSDLYPTAMLSTHQSTLFQYGYFESRIKLQTKPGHWSAFWMQSEANSNNTELPVPNPAGLGTEIDIMEHTIKGTASAPIHETQHALHWNGYGDGHKQSSWDALSSIPIDLNGFNTFGLLWTPTSYAFYINGYLSKESFNNISQVPEYLILSLETGLAFGGTPNPADFPDSLYVDYVRVYQSERLISGPTSVPEPVALTAIAGVIAFGLGRRRHSIE